MDIFGQHPFGRSFTSKKVDKLPSASPSINLLHESMVSRRGSTESLVSSRSEVIAETSEDHQFSSGRLSAEQAMILEQYFSDTPKPSIKTRRELSEVTGLSVQRVAVSNLASSCF